MTEEGDLTQRSIFEEPALAYNDNDSVQYM